ncbi:NAD(P)-dependent oxidoreductase [Rhodopseudomonas palustris]|uniref:NAD(P)-dependent oxidoreductase n=1 Tax=Rhodopseudomonas palustris TaxID=1076 RepID=A0A323UHA1_RHOPL|nr:NAD(P)-dependent oxidoreductase [Rhodopseudomonas palustris]PZA11731.1 NAD(P)-dependent oxidoreductase [Rhodopseudomonas palustris]
MSQSAAITPPARIAVIGLGNMGRPMSACLARAGYHVVGFDISAEARSAYAEAGGTAASTASDAVAGAAAVVTLLGDGKIVRSAIEGVKAHLAPGAVVIDMSSSAPIGTRALGEELIAAGFGFIDAPVSGGVKRAVDGTLAIMAGGDGATIDRAEPVLKAMGKSIFRTGPLGSGHAAKALNNYVSAAGLAAAVEALAIGGRFGIEPEVLVDVLNASTGRNNSTENKLKQFVIPEKYTSGFSLALMAKDIGTADELAHDIGVSAPLADQVTALWSAAMQALGPGADHVEIGRYLTAKR